MDKSIYSQKWTREAKEALVSQFFGFMLDAYDLLFVTAMTTILAGVLLPPPT